MRPGPAWRSCRRAGRRRAAPRCARRAAAARGLAAPDPPRATLLASRRLLDDAADHRQCAHRPAGARILADFIATAQVDEMIEVRLASTRTREPCPRATHRLRAQPAAVPASPFACRRATGLSPLSTTSASSRVCRSRCARSRSSPSLRSRAASRSARLRPAPRRAALTSSRRPLRPSRSCATLVRLVRRVRLGHAGLAARCAQPRAFFARRMGARGSWETAR